MISTEQGSFQPSTTTSQGNTRHTAVTVTTEPVLSMNASTTGRSMRSLHQSQASRKSKNPMPVYLNVYEMTTGGPFTAYHSGIAFENREYSFFKNGGISWHQPQKAKNGKHAKSVLLGKIPGVREFNNAINAVRPNFERGTYDIVRKNCNDFTDAVCEVLFDKHIPGYVNRLARLGRKKIFKCCVPLFVEDKRSAQEKRQQEREIKKRRDQRREDQRLAATYAPADARSPRSKDAQSMAKSKDGQTTTSKETDKNFPSTTAAFQMNHSAPFAWEAPIRRDSTDTTESEEHRVDASRQTFVSRQRSSIPRQSNLSSQSQPSVHSRYGRQSVVSQMSAMNLSQIATPNANRYSNPNFQPASPQIFLKSSMGPAAGASPPRSQLNSSFGPATGSCSPRSQMRYSNPRFQQAPVCSVRGFVPTATY